jgi:hypothetical protein
MIPLAVVIGLIIVFAIELFWILHTGERADSWKAGAHLRRMPSSLIRSLPPRIVPRVPRL